MSSMSDVAPMPPVERRQRERRQSLRRGQDRHRVDERRQMAVVVYVTGTAIAAAGFAVGMWAGWFVWGTP